MEKVASKLEKVASKTRKVTSKMRNPASILQKPASKQKKGQFLFSKPPGKVTNIRTISNEKGFIKKKREIVQKIRKD
jgi:hypothetical protein